jgi:hypothetical protein
MLRPMIEDFLHLSRVPGHDDVGEQAQSIGHRLHLVGLLGLMTRDATKAVLQAGSRLDQERTIAHEPDLPPRSDNPPPALTFAFDGGYARRTRRGPRRKFEILTGACEKNGKIRVFATAFQGSKSLRERLSRFVGRVGYDQENPTALMTDGAGSLLRLKRLLPVPTRLVLDYFHVAMKVRHADQCIGRIPPYRFSPNGSLVVSIEAAGGRQADIAAAVMREVLRFDWDAVVSEVRHNHRPSCVAIGSFPPA